MVGTVANTSVTVAVAAIAHDLDVPISITAVTVVLLNVSMAYAMPMAGIVAHAIGSRRSLMASGLLLVGSSMLLAYSPNLTVLGLARVGQGVALAGVTPTSVQVSTELLDGPRRGRALGWWAASNGIGLAFGPLVGGLLLDLAGWRWVAVPAIVLGIGVIVTAGLGVPGDLRHDPGIPKRLVLGISLAAGSTMTGLAALAAEAWVVAVPSVALAVGSVLMVRRAIRGPDGPPELRGWLRDANARLASLGAGLQMIANGLVQVTVPAWLIVSGILTGAQAGAVLMAMTLTMAAMGLLTGGRHDVAYRRWFSWGVGGCVVGLALLAVASLVAWWITVPALVVLGLGAGALLSPSLTGFSHTPAGHNAVGLAVFNTLRLGSFAVGGLIGGTLLDAGLPWLAFTVAATGLAVPLASVAWVRRAA